MRIPARKQIKSASLPREGRQTVDGLPADGRESGLRPSGAGRQAMPTGRRAANGSGMIDVSEKDVTRRTARASARISMSAKAFNILMTEGSPKGDVFETAKIAGILAAKSAPSLIPMCHPLGISKVGIRFDIDRKRHAVCVIAEVVCIGRTGVEMEALTACAVAALTVYDMMKWADREMVISDVKLLYKSGGKSGTFCREGSA